MPGTSPSERAADNVLRSHITIGGMQKPDALTQPTTVIWVLSPEIMEQGLRTFEPMITFGGFGLRGMPVSSMLKMRHGREWSSYASTVSSSKSKYLSIIPQSVAAARAILRSWIS